MTREKAKELLPAMQYFANGGDLWFYDGCKWFKQKTLYSTRSYKAANIMGDKHFEARKVFALGEEIEMEFNNKWVKMDDPSWGDENDYRPKPKEEVYEWQWIVRNKYSNIYELTKKHRTENDKFICNDLWEIAEKFEPSKRLRK